MNKTIAFRADETLTATLEARARETGTTVSDVVRHTLRQAFAERPHADRIGHLKGKLNLESAADPWRRSIRDRNWRP